MKIKNLHLFFIISFISTQIFAQKTGVLIGSVRDKNTQELLTGVIISVEGTQIASSSDEEGRYKIENIPVGSYSIKATFLGYQPVVKHNINISSGNAMFLSFELVEDLQNLEEVEVTVNRTKQASMANIVTPNSTQSLTTEEIRANPGGNFDISRVIQVLPGVGGGGSGGGGPRNDIIIRGGAPNENVYYLDDIEIPQINHFATQGSAGGPQGILNTAFVEDVKLSSSAFDAKYDNALASTFEIKQREGNPDRFSGNIRLSGTELATTFEGPINKKTTYLVSARRSYLQLLFQAIDLPIRPNYWDFQYKVTHKIDKKNTLNFIGVGAIDEFSFAKTRNSTPSTEYIRRANPIINQWTYTTGVIWKRLIKNGYINVSASRNMFNNALDRWEDDQRGNEERRALKIRSQEIENKFRIDINKNAGSWKYSYGAMAQYVKFNNNLFQKLTNEFTLPDNTVVPAIVLNYNTAIEFFRYGAFGQVSRSFWGGKLGTSFGIRTDMNTFTNRGNNPIDNLSPRGSVSYFLTNKWKVSASIGRYAKIPIYTLLGFKDNNNNYVNKDLRYTQAIHYVSGVEFLPKEDLRFTLEGFYKDYSNVPVSVRDGISLANKGAEFGAIGNEAAVSTGKGQAYGFEFYVQKKLTRNFFGVLSYTYVRSLFSGANGKLLPSAWDSRHIISGVFGVKFRKGWELGGKHRFLGGNPYTPYDLVESQRNFLTLGVGTLDFNQLNSLRLNSFNQFDIRIDKKWNFKRWSFDLFLDIQNLFRFNTPSIPTYTFERTPDNTAFATTDGQPIRQDGSNAIPVILTDESPFFVPSIGFIIEF